MSEINTNDVFRYMTKNIADKKFIFRMTNIFSIIVILIYMSICTYKYDFDIFELVLCWCMTLSYSLRAIITSTRSLLNIRNEYFFETSKIKYKTMRLLILFSGITWCVCYIIELFRYSFKNVTFLWLIIIIPIMKYMMMKSYYILIKNTVFYDRGLFLEYMMCISILNKIDKYRDTNSLNVIKYEDYLTEKSAGINENEIVINDDCVICFEKFIDNDNIILLKCNHIYHQACISSWIKINNTCPTCRENINIMDIRQNNIINDEIL